MLNRALVTAALLLLAAPLAAEPAGSAPPIPDTRRAVVSEFADEADRPASPIKVVIPAVDAPEVSVQIKPGDELLGTGVVEDLPMEPVAEVLPPPATFFGVTVSGSTVFVIDRSASMNLPSGGTPYLEDAQNRIIVAPSRLQVVKAEMSRALNELRETDKFALVFFGGYPLTTADEGLNAATPANVRASLHKVNETMASSTTPTLSGLTIACRRYGTELTSMVLLSDGQPNCGETPEQTLGAFPGMFQPLGDNGCQFTAVHMGPVSGGAWDFMQNLANTVSGQFISR